MGYYHVTIFPVYWGRDCEIVRECLDHVFDAVEVIALTRVIGQKEVFTVLAWTDKDDVWAHMGRIFKGHEFELNQSFVPEYHEWHEQFCKLQAKVQAIPYERMAAAFAEVLPADRCGA